MCFFLRAQARDHLNDFEGALEDIKKVLEIESKYVDKKVKI